MPLPSPARLAPAATVWNQEAGRRQLLCASSRGARHFTRPHSARWVFPAARSAPVSAAGGNAGSATGSGGAARREEDDTSAAVSVSVLCAAAAAAVHRRARPSPAAVFDSIRLLERRPVHDRAFSLADLGGAWELVYTTTDTRRSRGFYWPGRALITFSAEPEAGEEEGRAEELQTHHIRNSAMLGPLVLHVDGSFLWDDRMKARRCVVSRRILLFLHLLFCLNQLRSGSTKPAN